MAEVHPLLHPDLSIQAVPLDDGAHAYVVDDVLRDPGRLRDWAVARRGDFRAVADSLYPGIGLPLPDALTAALRAFYAAYVQPRFDAVRLEGMLGRLAMVTLAPGALTPPQWLCHADDFRLPPWQSIQASVLYLFDDAALGGTSFYRARQPVARMRQLFADAARLSGPAFTARHGIAAGYLTGDNDYVERVASIPPRFNRMVFYDGSILHSGDIPAPDHLTADPARGRLTLNGFFSARRHGS